MAKTTAPMLSFGARGQIGKSAVYAKWRGVNYVRQHTVPSNPNTVGQQSTRNTFRYLTQVWKAATSTFQSVWDLFATGRPFTGRNAAIGQNTTVLRGASNNDDFIFSPGANGPMGPPTITVTPAATSLKCNATNPTVPSGWTLSAQHFFAIPKQDPALDFTGLMAGGSNATPTFATVNLTGLTTAQTYQVGGICEFIKPNLETAYSVASTTKSVPT